MIDAAAHVAVLQPPVLVAEGAPRVLAGTPQADTPITLFSTPLQYVLLSTLPYRDVIPAEVHVVTPPLPVTRGGMRNPCTS